MNLNLNLIASTTLTIIFLTGWVRVTVITEFCWLCFSGLFYTMIDWGDRCSLYLNETLVFIYHHYVDIYYMRWLAWVFYPLYLTFILPIVLLVFLYLSSIFLHVYRVRHQLKAAVSRDRWDGGRQILAALWDAQGRIWHGLNGFSINNLCRSCNMLCPGFQMTVK